MTTTSTTTTSASTTSTGVDNVAVELSTVELTNPSDQKNAQIILTQRTTYTSNLTHYQKIYNRWYYGELATNYTIHFVTFVTGILLGIQYYMPASKLMVAIISPINIVLPLVYCGLHGFLFQTKIDRFSIVVKSLQDYINQITIFYNKAVQSGSITDAEMTSFNSLVTPFNTQLTTEINTANSEPVNMGVVFQEIKAKITSLITEIETLRTTKPVSSSAA
jgi:hypothetical protein